MKRKKNFLNYKKYMRSKKWKARRKLKGESVNWTCEKCGDNTPPMFIHHKHYDTLGNESNSDLEALCKNCHEAKHKRVLEMDQHMDALGINVLLGDKDKTTPLDPA